MFQIKKIFVALLCLIFLQNISAQDKNPVLKNTFTLRDGNFVVVDTWGELRKSDFSSRRLEKMEEDLRSAIKVIEQQERTIEQQKRSIDDLKKTVRDLQEQVKRLK